MLLRKEAAIYQAAMSGGAEIRACKQLLADAAGLAARWPAMPVAEKQEVVRSSILLVTVLAGSVGIEVRLARLLDMLETKAEGARPDRYPEMPTTVLSVPAELTRT